MRAPKRPDPGARPPPPSKDGPGRQRLSAASRGRVQGQVLDEKDVDGKQFVRERVRIAKEAGKGWQEYKFQNPMTKQIEQKIAYLERVDDVIVLCGAYKK